MEWGNPVLKVYEEGRCGMVFVSMRCIKIVETNKASFNIGKVSYYTPDGKKFTNEQGLMNYLGLKNS